MPGKLGNESIGAKVKIKIDGTDKNFIVIHQGKPGDMYDESCNGTWLLMEDIYANMVWDSGKSNILEASDIDAYLNNTFFNLIDESVRSKILEAKIPYRKNGGSGGTDQSGLNGLPRKVFMLSGYEVGWTNSTNSGFPNDGAKLSYFISGTTSAANNKRIAKLNGSSTSWWLRSPCAGYTGDALYVNSGGDWVRSSASNSYGVRPAFILPSSLFVSDDGHVIAIPTPVIGAPDMAMEGQSLTVKWNAANGAESYVLQKKVDSGSWSNVYEGTATLYKDSSITGSIIYYRVASVVSGIQGDFSSEAMVEVKPAGTLVISGSDGSIGTINTDYSYTVITDTGEALTVEEKINGSTFRTHIPASGATNKISIFDLPAGSGTIEITATVQNFSMTRTITYNKAKVTWPNSGDAVQTAQDGRNQFPVTLAELVRIRGGKNLDELSESIGQEMDALGRKLDRALDGLKDTENIVSDIGNLHVWRKTQIVSEEIPAKIIKGEPEYCFIRYEYTFNLGISCRIQTCSSISVNDFGQINFTGSITTTSVSNSGGFATDIFVNKYIRVHPDDVTDDNKDLIIWVPPEATWVCNKNSNSSSYIAINGGQKITGQPKIPPGTHVTYLTSTNRNAYQEGDDAKEEGYVLGDVVSNKKIGQADVRTSTAKFDIEYSDSVLVDEFGNVNLSSNKQWFRDTIGSTIKYYNYLSGNFCVLRPPTDGSKSIEIYHKDIFYIPPESTVVQTPISDTIWKLEVSQLQPVTGYPAIPAGTTIEYLGVLGDKTSIETGSYVGTGTYGKANPNTLTFSFDVKLFVVQGADENNYQIARIAVKGSNLFGSSSATNSHSAVTWNGRTVSWYGDDASAQGNRSGSTYYYAAFG